MLLQRRIWCARNIHIHSSPLLEAHATNLWRKIYCSKCLICPAITTTFQPLIFKIWWRWSTPLTPIGIRMTLLHQENIHSPHFLVTHITRHRKKIYLCTNTIIFQHYFFHVSVSPVQFQPTQMIGKGQFWIPTNDLLVYITIYNLFVQFWLAMIYILYLNELVMCL